MEFFPNFFTFNALLNANRRFLWAIAVSCIVCFCHYRPDCLLRKLLSLSIWMPIEKMGFSLFVTHFSVIVNSVVKSNNPIGFSSNQIVSSRVKNFVIFLNFSLTVSDFLERLYLELLVSIFVVLIN